MRKLLLSLLFGTGLILTGTSKSNFVYAQPNAEQKLAVYAKPAVVRIIAGCRGNYDFDPPGKDGQKSSHDFSTIGLGTGYFINPKGYILTNAHVVEAAKDGEVGCRERLFDNLVRELEEVNSLENVDQETIDYYEKYAKLRAESFEYHQNVWLPNINSDNVDIFEFDIKEIGSLKPGSSKDVAVIKIQLNNAPTLRIGDSDTVELRDKVLAIGYPFTGDAINQLQTDSILESTVTGGSVSNINKRLTDNSLILQLDLAVSNGSSGSPVLNESGEVVGMITFGGTNVDGALIPFAIRTSELFEFISQAGTTHEEGTVDRLYKQGLEFAWKKDYTGAKAKFEAVRDLFPQHSEIDRLLKDNNTDIAEAWDNPNYNFLIGGLGAVAIILLGAYLINRRKAVPEAAVVGAEPAYLPSSSSGSKSVPMPLNVQPNTAQDNQQTTTLISPDVSEDPFLELRNQYGNVERLFLQAAQYKIGRDRTWSDIAIPDLGWDVISRRQAFLRKEEESYRIYDGDGTKATTNGIFVNGLPVDPQEGYLLNHGDRLTIGNDSSNQVIITYCDPSKNGYPM